jgi:glyoxylase-like metal-dependent hydrolase (beta-lactamase superfamily II)
MGFLREDKPDYGTPEPVTTGLRRLVAANPGPMTYYGTNSWLLERENGTVVIDPGPEDDTHVAAILNACPRGVAAILLTHTHPDHVGAAPLLKAASGAPIAGWHTPWLTGFVPDISLEDGQDIAGLQAIYTPGHASDHLCFTDDTGMLFSGDHVMSWNTSIVSPPDGDMAAYMESLRLLLARDDRFYCCGHGPVLPDPSALVRALLVHRVARESAIAASLSDTPQNTDWIVDQLYNDLDTRLKPAASRTVLAHLLKLQEEGRATELAEGWKAHPSA